MEHAYQAYSETIEAMQLREDMGLDGLRSELIRFWDGLLLSIAPAVSDPYVRGAYKILIQQAKTQSQSFGWLEEPEVFQSITPNVSQKAGKPWLGIAAALILAGLALWCSLPHPGRSIPMAVVSGAALLLLLVQGALSLMTRPGAGGAGPVHTRVEQRISPRRVRSGLQQAVREMDAHVDSLQAMLRETADLPEDVDITLAKDLLRLPASLRSDAVTDAVDLYLARNGIERIDYSRERAGLFMLLPAAHDATVEPALVKGDKVLSEGVACVKAEG